MFLLLPDPQYRDFPIKIPLNIEISLYLMLHIKLYIAKLLMSIQIEKKYDTW